MPWFESLFQMTYPTTPNHAPEEYTSLVTGFAAVRLKIARAEAELHCKPCRRMHASPYRCCADSPAAESGQAASPAARNAGFPAVFASG